MLVTLRELSGKSFKNLRICAIPKITKYNI